MAHVSKRMDLPPATGVDENQEFSTPNVSKRNRMDALKEQASLDQGVNMSPKQTKLLSRLHELMRSFKQLKNRVKTMQDTGTAEKVYAVDQELFQKFREQKEAEIAEMREGYETQIRELKEKHAREMEVAVAAAVQSAREDKERAILDVEFELKEEARRKEMTDSAKKAAALLDSGERRQSAVSEGINKQLDEYPEELRGMLMFDGSP